MPEPGMTSRSWSVLAIWALCGAFSITVYYLVFTAAYRPA